MKYNIEMVGLRKQGSVGVYYFHEANSKNNR